jgi:ThiF family protein
VTIGGPAGDGNPAVSIVPMGWDVEAGGEVAGADDNPVGAAAAAALAAIDCFEQVFAAETAGRSSRVESGWRWSAWSLGDPENSPRPRPLHFADVCVAGVGAVTHGLLWILERWPAPITGTLHLIDPDRYDSSNGQRYVGMRAVDVGGWKAEAARDRIKLAHPELDVQAHNVGMNEFVASLRPDAHLPLVVAGLDSKDARRQLAAKLPLRLVNMWTERDGLGASRHGTGDGWRCLYCVYPDDVTDAPDELVLLVNETGLLPRRVRELLDSGVGITAEDAAAVASRSRVPVEQLVDRPLRSVRAQLCATGAIQSVTTLEEVTVAFPFSSLLAGIGGWSELVREINGIPSEPYFWAMDVLHPPMPGHLWPVGPRHDCWLCSDALTLEVIEAKYGGAPTDS